jgi:ribosomal-protein-alanine N-acetyltransferase
MWNLKSNIIETERLILRPLVLSDAETAYNGWTGDADVAEWVSWLPHHSLDDTIEWLKLIEWKPDKDGGIVRSDNYIWGFVLKETGELFGSGGLIWEDDWKLYQVGYNIMKKHWRKGYATEAMKAILSFAASALGIKRVLGGHAKANPASGRVLEKLGFVYQKDSIQPHIDGQRFFDSKDYLLELTKPSVPLRRYRHYKGNDYEVIGFAKHSETDEDMVIYKALYGEGGTWARPLSMWENPIEVDGKTVKRFEYIGDDSVRSESTPEELSEALRSITSTLSKREKALTKLRVGTPQYTLTDRRIKAFRIVIV